MNSDKVIGIEIIRILAILLVVLCHSTEIGIYVFDVEHMNSYSISEMIYAQTLFTLGKISVPLFLLITGYLLLDKSYDTSSVLRFWKKKWIHLLLVIQIWILVYDLFLKFYMDNDIPWKQVIIDVLFLHKVTMSHTWYMPMIIGLYVLIPFVASALEKYHDIVKIPLIFYFVVLFVYPFTVVLMNALKGHTSISPQIYYGFSGGIYGVYLITGYLVKTDMSITSRLNNAILFIGMLVFIVLGIIIQYVSYSNNIQYNIWNDSPLLFFAALFLFQLVLNLRIKNDNSFIRFLSSNAFGVYLIHMIYKYLLLDYISIIPVLRPLKAIILWIVLVTLSYITTFFIRRIPKVGNWLLYTRYEQIPTN